MLRQEAIQLLNELTTTYPDLLASTAHISLQLSEGDTKLMIKSRLDFEQKTALMDVIKGKGWKIVDSSTLDVGTVLLIY